MWERIKRFFKKIFNRDMISINSETCSSSISIKTIEGDGLVATVSPFSEASVYPICCLNCDTPEVSTTLYEGSSFIPFRLNMIDGTKVIENRTGGFGHVYDGKGVIELNEPLVAGSAVQLSVKEAGCNVTGELIKVMSLNEDCECVNENHCNINFKSFQAETFGGSVGKITKIELDSDSEVYYRLGESAWVDDITLLPVFILNQSITLGVKSKSDPSCRREILIGAVKTSEESAPEPPLIFPTATSVVAGETTRVFGNCLSGTILWSNGSTDNEIFVGAGTYTATCTNSVGTSDASEPLVITELSEPVLLPTPPTITTDKSVITGNEVATLSGSCSIGTLRWSTGESSPIKLVGQSLANGGANFTATCVNELGSSLPSNTVTVTWVETANNCVECVEFDPLLPAAPASYLGAISGINTSTNVYVDGWAIDTNNPNTEIPIDVYIDNYYVGTAQPYKYRPDVAAAHGGNNNTFYGWRLDLDYLYWWQDGTPKSIDFRFAGTSTSITNSSNTISKAGGGDGNCLVYSDGITVDTYIGNVTYVDRADMAARGLSTVPYANEYDLIETATYRLGFSNEMGLALDWVGKKTDTESWLTQRDSGIQGYQHDPYIGDVSEVQAIFAARGYTTDKPDRNWNGLPQGVYQGEMIGEGTYTAGANFGGDAITKSWNPTTKVFSSESNLWQYAFLDSSGQKVLADSSTRTQNVRVVADNVFEFENTLNLNLDFLSGLQDNASLSLYAFYAFTKFKKLKYYGGKKPFSNDPIVANVDLTVLSNTNYVNNRSEDHNFVSTEKWAAVFNNDETEGIGMVWNQDHRYSGSMHIENKHDRGGAVLYLPPYRTRGVFPNEVVTDKVYLVMGTLQEIRDFAYKLNGYPCGDTIIEGNDVVSTVANPTNIIENAFDVNGSVVTSDQWLD